MPPGFRLDSDLTEPATAGDRVQAGLAGSVSGVASIVGLPIDTMHNMVDLGKAAIGSGYTALTGNAPPAALEVESDRSNVIGSSQWFRKQFENIGASTTPARPDDSTSRYLYAAGSALPAGMTGRLDRVGQAAAPVVSAAAPGIVRQATNLVTRAAATPEAQAGLIGTVPELVRDSGGEEGAQMAGTLAASVLVPTAAATARGVGAAVQPITEAGRRTIAGAAIRNAATNADDAGRQLGSVSQLVPGSRPTTGQAARDPGIAFFENRLRALNAPAFSERVAAQNEARQKLIDSVARGGTDDAVSALESRRESVTSALREKAFQEAKGKAAPTQDVVRRIDDLLEDPENAGRSVQQALKSVRGQLFNDAGEIIDNPQSLYAIRKEINRVLEGKYVDSNESVLRYAGGQLKEVRTSIDDAIETVAPSWRPYLTKYAQLSRPIERAETLRSIRGRTDTAAPDIQTGRSYLSQAKWKNVVSKNLPELQKTFTKGQIQKLQMISADLDRGAAAAGSASVKVPGSDTAANLVVNGQLSVANIIGRTLGREAKDLPPALGTITRPLSFVYKLPDESIRTLIVDAMLDPDLARQLMKEGTRENVEAFANSLQRQAQVSGLIVLENQGQ